MQRTQPEAKMIAFALCVMLVASICLAGCIASPAPTEATQPPTTSPTTSFTAEPTTMPGATPTTAPTTAPTTDPTLGTTAPPTTEHVHVYNEEIVAATCTEDGYTIFTCSCGDSYRGNEMDAKGHSYEESVVKPTCTEKGYTVHTCSACGNSYRENETSAKGHSYTQTVVAATTEAEGYTEYVCDCCGHSYRDNYTEKLVVFTDVNETVYATATVNVRSGPGTGYDRLGSLDENDSVQRTGIGSNGWSRVVYNGQEAYVHSDYLTTTKPATNTGSTDGSGETPDEPSTGDEPSGGDEIIYTYTDGTTGTEPRDGATYIDERGVKRTYWTPRDASGRAAGDICEFCGKPVSIKTQINEVAYCSHNSWSSYCSRCGAWVDAYTCHDCIDHFDGIYYCDDCGRVCGSDGSNGKCVRWMTGGNHICSACGTTVPGHTCHTCDNP